MQKPSPDELAQGLSEIPMTIEGFEIDEAGFHRARSRFRKEIHVSWRDIASIRPFGLAMLVETLGTSDRAEVVLKAAGTDPAAVGVMCAWREYLLRTIERYGELRGTAVLHPESTSPRLKLALAGFFALLLFGIPGGVLAGMAPASITWLTWLKVVAWVVPAAAFVGAVFWEGLRDLRDLARWRSWRLIREGVSFYRRGKQRVLSPGLGDKITPDAAWIKGERIPLAHLTGHPVLVQIMAALGERAGAKIGTGVAARAGCVVLLLALPLYFLLLAKSLWAVLPVILVLAVVDFAATLRRRTLVTLADGRAMLERLGW